jgi:hypothetical protein
MPPRLNLVATEPTENRPLAFSPLLPAGDISGPGLSRGSAKVTEFEYLIGASRRGIRRVQSVLLKEKIL